MREKKKPWPKVKLFQWKANASASTGCRRAFDYKLETQEGSLSIHLVVLALFYLGVSPHALQWRELDRVGGGGLYKYV